MGSAPFQPSRTSILIPTSFASGVPAFGDVAVVASAVNVNGLFIATGNAMIENDGTTELSGADIGPMEMAGGLDLLLKNNTYGEIRSGATNILKKLDLAATAPDFWVYAFAYVVR
jgi:hypothetical protein